MKIEFYHIDAFEVANYEPIWRALKEMGVEANLVAVPGNKNTSGGEWFDFDRFKTYCNERNLPFTTVTDTNANIAVTTQNANILRDYHCPRTRIMYGPIVYPKAWGLQPHAVQPFDGILTHGKLYANYYAKWLKTEQLPIVGYPRYDAYFAGQLSRQNIREKWGVQDQKPVIVFLPTWGDNTAFDLFLPTLLTLKHDYHIILRPHHCTLRLEPKRMQQLRESGLFILDNAFDLAEVYAGADVILSDVRSGGLFEACLCNVPTVGMVIDSSELGGWLAEHQIEKIITLCSQPQQLNIAIQTALHSKEQKLNRKHWAAERVAYQDGQAGQQAAKALIQLAIQHYRSRVVPVAPSVMPISPWLTPTFKTNLENN